MKRLIPLLIASAIVMCNVVSAQTNMLTTNLSARSVMKGNYNPTFYKPSVEIKDPVLISKEINDRISPDTLKAYIETLQSFETRHTSSDTTSQTRSIGAARRWAYQKFRDFRTQNENRLLPSYFQFDQMICGVEQHRNVLAVLPGNENLFRSVIIIEGHLDSRCENNCDTNCVARGVEDNATGAALVLELARVMSKYTFSYTIVFMLTTSEEQGLNGASAFAQYCKDEKINIRGVLNNDVVGSIICGQTASPPGCMGAGTIDSTNLRLFSDGGFNSPHKQLARYVKLEYKEMLEPIVSVPMTANIMTPIDRSGRGGDHIPFSNEGYPAIRFCAANEHGNADVSDPFYKDRQHTSGDILGVDTDNDNIIDSFFIDFNYLARMCVINGNTAAMMGLGPETPDFEIATTTGGNGISVFITSQKQYQNYRVAVRSTTNDWDSVYTISGDHGYIQTGNANTKCISVAAVDNNGTESPFSEEKLVQVGIVKAELPQNGVELLQNKPNPFDGETVISIVADKDMPQANSFIVITDVAGKVVKRMPVMLRKGMNEITYQHGYNATGTYIYSLYMNGEKVQSKRMIFAN